MKGNWHWLFCAVSLWLALCVTMFGGCASLGTDKPPSMGCVDPLAADCDDPSAYPPLTAQLPPWPFPRLLVPIPEGDRR
jgi:hypothetical protein